MHKLTSVALLAVSALILGGCTKKTTQTPSQTLNETTEFAKAIESGIPTFCVLTKDANKMEFHIQGKKTATTTITTISGKTTVGHMINDGTYLYTWDQSSQQGSKIALDVVDANTSPAPTPSALAFDNAEDYDYYQNMGYTINCQKESVDDSRFTPPTNVKFIDPTEMMRAIPSPNADGEFDIKSTREELKNKYQLLVEPPSEQ